MEKVTDINHPQAQKAVSELAQKFKERPTKEQVIQWFESDIHAATYALSAICSTPSLMKQLAEKFYDETTRQMEVTDAENKLKK
jgi:hypothetical protein